ncbi:hypothetical protein Loa_02430 [Legionella oakridgensis ATCC 33761 = DSM 21215]|uniref:Uncharacterized protein n=1 Tax=Legionella oakridgensis ATCC 33761 = DSM 21215 TaxID=1268635 RepID=W0BH63_9GAMM|nr:hypothetical protein Loa_02430 [Legionella oakridgensis ATCC 33761 = DSM 21215]
MVLKVARETVIDVSKLRKSFDNKVVVDEVDLQVKKGKYLVFSARTAAGKRRLFVCFVGY